jgi:hypothetical protein
VGEGEGKKKKPSPLKEGGKKLYERRGHMKEERAM